MDSALRGHSHTVFRTQMVWEKVSGVHIRFQDSTLADRPHRSSGSTAVLRYHRTNYQYRKRSCRTATTRPRAPTGGTAPAAGRQGRPLRLFLRSCCKHIRVGNTHGFNIPAQVVFCIYRTVGSRCIIQPDLSGQTLYHRCSVRSRCRHPHRPGRILSVQIHTVPDIPQIHPHR